MVAKPARPYRSANAGEFSDDARGRIDVKQYYSAGLAFKNIEPVPQSGFRQMGGTWRIGRWRQPLAGLAITSPSLSAGPHTGNNNVVWTGTVSTLSLGMLSIEGFAVSAGNAAFTAQALVSGVWTNIAGPFTVATGTPVTRLAAFEPGRFVATTSIRIIASFTVSATVAIAAVRAFVEDGIFVEPRMVELNTDEGARLMCVVAPQIADFWTSDGYQGSALVETVTAAMLPDIDFYAEGRTIGIFHGDLETARLFLASTVNLRDWAVDDWPYDPPPKADLGNVYVKTDDVWEMSVRFVGNLEQWITLSVNGETTPAIAHRDSMGNVIAFPAFDPTTYALYAAAMQAALEALPGLGTGVTVSSDGGHAGFWTFTITFGGALAGVEYEFFANFVNSADGAALAYHIEIGETELEPLFSATAGWPGSVDLVQDRQALSRLPSARGAMALSRIAEYFDFNVAGRTEDAARLDRIRSQTSETILTIKESKYLLVFTDRGVYFVTNRTFERNTPLNFVSASEIGAQPNCKPMDLEGVVYYVAINPGGIDDAALGGNQLLSLVYDDVSTAYNAEAKSLLASHLVQKLIRAVRQKPVTDQDAGKGWLMRADGRLIAAQIIRNQDITGFCEWQAAANGLVREIRIDGRNRLWMAVAREANPTIELYDPAIYLQETVTRTGDMTGIVTGLDHLVNGTEVWAVPGDHTHAIGPYLVNAGQIALGDYYPGDILVGRWQKPRFESMPDVLVTQADEVVIRPGRIHTAHLNVIDTGSIAIGANGTTPRDVVLREMGDDAGSPVPLKTKRITVSGIPGMVEYPTLVVTQVRPGPLRVRDYAVEVKL